MSVLNRAAVFVGGMSSQNIRCGICNRDVERVTMTPDPMERAHELEVRCHGSVVSYRFTQEALENARRPFDLLPVQAFPFVFQSRDDWGPPPIRSTGAGLIDLERMARTQRPPRQVAVDALEWKPGRRRFGR